MKLGQREIQRLGVLVALCLIFWQISVAAAVFSHDDRMRLHGGFELYRRKKRRRYNQRVKLHSSSRWFLEQLQTSGEQRWRRFMRLSKPLFLCVSKRLGQILNMKSIQDTEETFKRQRGRPTTSIEHAFGAVLYQLAHGISSSAECVGIFGISDAAFSRYRAKILAALVGLREEVIYWPRVDEYDLVKLGFDRGPQGRVRLPGVSQQ